MTPRPLALAPTPPRARLCAAVAAASDRARARFPSLTPSTVYLTAADAHAAGFAAAHFSKSDPPRCHGLPVRLILGRGRSRLYCQGGIAIGLARDLQATS